MTYKQAKKLPKGGAVAMTEDNMQALMCDMFGRRFGVYPEKIWEWSAKHNLVLKNLFGYVTLGDFLDAILNDKLLEPDRKLS